MFLKQRYLYYNNTTMTYFKYIVLFCIFQSFELFNSFSLNFLSW